MILLEAIHITVDGLCNHKEIPTQRVCCFVTKQCNFRCAYCNMKFANIEMSESVFDSIVNKYPDAIIHITGGEPSCVKWLYPYLESHKGIFHLNTNAFIKPPQNIRRMKISFDTMNEHYFNILCHHKDAFKKVCEHIKYASSYATTSLTCVLTKENYKEAPNLMAWCLENFPRMYALFFSVYKGDNPRFVFDAQAIEYFFSKIKPDLEDRMDPESFALFRETIDEKFRIISGKRFPENDLNGPCYISMSEKIFDTDGSAYNCSHLYRDGIKHLDNKKHEKCLYGCNRRLVKFNQEVEALLKCEEKISVAHV
jgi:MoaA/NifB/PqqE/SkfB family radical SAM enzyme